MSRHKNAICGVYKITNKESGEFYIGASVDVLNRWTTHFGRDFKHYPHRKFYQDIIMLGREGFDCEVLEECEESKLLEREQYYYDLLKPTYNFTRPTKCPFTDEKVKRLARKAQEEKLWVKMREPEERKKASIFFKEVAKCKWRAVDVYSVTGEYLRSFDNMTMCAQWISETTPFVGKNKVSKIQEVCKGTRRVAFGYKFKYKNSGVINE